ncbi:MAG: YqaE/Pmp3 family membrane protein [Aliidiomarina sp.]|uniref:YqaE/Pmp3 family membrane protein n=1 Tax=Aliidiomarina sp. TaxID=1872439 RepID=UPI0025BE5ED1|nr:YqaE/Pmp3 family membrane protein [Aliidiomarina sp.]MCH8500701.1 YqaE/Pmp3 family membrane protein [Aliidiomarina sp.]
MPYLLAVVLPPVAVFLSGARKQMYLSLLLFLVALYLLKVAGTGNYPGAYAAGPVLWVAAIIHAFILTHRKFQQQSGMRHPHRGSWSQSQGKERTEDDENPKV